MPARAGIVSAVLLVAGSLTAAPVSAQDPSTAELKKAIQALAESVKAMQKDLQDIKTLLQQGRQPSEPQNVVLDVGNNPSRGVPTAKLTMVEFTDYQCPFCSRYVRETYPQIEKEYITTGKLKYVLMDLPLESIHKHAFKAAEVAHCAGDQGKYWEMHDQLFSNQKTIDSWSAHAEAVGLDSTRFDSCLASGKYSAEIRGDITQAQRAGVAGTPGFFLAITEPGSTRVKSVKFLRGAQPFAAFKAEIDRLLEAATKSPTGDN
jgi:protein-disulfide isomerase